MNDACSWWRPRPLELVELVVEDLVVGEGPAGEDLGLHGVEAVGDGGAVYRGGVEVEEGEEGGRVLVAGGEDGLDARGGECWDGGTVCTVVVGRGGAVV